MEKFLISAINFYQRFLSPDHSFWAKHRFPYGYCRFAPSCSEYMKQAILKYGAGKGTMVGLWRILRCNPFSAGGVDAI